jgi:putative dimethyl sulfoxide reductase chaperone
MTTHDTLTARAVLWGWTARAFTYPARPLLDALHDQAERGRLQEAARATNDDAIGAALRAVWTALDAPDEATIALEEEHTFLFGRHVRVPPYESSYVLERGTDRSTHLTEVGGLYAAFGLTVSAAHPEMPDHLGAECELLAVLLAKEAYARAMGWATRARLTRRARRKLVQEHLGRWLPAFSERLAQHHRLALYPALAGLLLALLGHEERQLNLPPGAVLAPLATPALHAAPVPETADEAESALPECAALGSASS